MRPLFRSPIKQLFRRKSTVQITQPKQVFTPSFRTSLTLLGTTVMGVGLYSTYQVAYCGSTVFIPYWLCAKQRKPLKSDLDRQLFIDQTMHRLQDRLAVDEEVHKVLGTPVWIKDSKNYEETWDVIIRSSEPGIKGVSISPDPLNFQVEARPFAANSGIDRVLLPFMPGQADSEDAVAKKTNQEPRVSRVEALVSGSVELKGSKHGGAKSALTEANGTRNGLQEANGTRTALSEATGTKNGPTGTTATVDFTAVQSLDHPKSWPKFTSGVLTISDNATKETIYTRRLW